MASTRLRRAFRYPDSDSEEDGAARLEMDDQEQESLIQILRVQNEQHDARYKLILTIFPLACVVGYVPTLVSTSGTMLSRFLAILSIASLLSTWQSVRQMSSRRLDNKGKHSIQELGISATLKENQRAVNTVLCAALVTLYIQGDTPDPGDAFLYFLLLVPGVVLVVTWVAEKAMMSVDIECLESLKYEYKGA